MDQNGSGGGVGRICGSRAGVREEREKREQETKGQKAGLKTRREKLRHPCPTLPDSGAKKVSAIMDLLELDLQVLVIQLTWEPHLGPFQE